METFCMFNLYFSGWHAYQQRLLHWNHVYGGENVISISCIHLAFCFLSLLAYLLLTHFCGFLCNCYHPHCFESKLGWGWSGTWKEISIATKRYLFFDKGHCQLRCSWECEFWHSTVFRNTKPARTHCTVFLRFRLFFKKFRYFPISTSYRTRGQSWLQAKGDKIDFLANVEKERNQKQSKEKLAIVMIKWI